MRQLVQQNTSAVLEAALMSPDQRSLPIRDENAARSWFIHHRIATALAEKFESTVQRAAEVANGNEKRALGHFVAAVTAEEVQVSAPPVGQRNVQLGRALYTVPSRVEVRFVERLLVTATRTSIGLFRNSACTVAFVALVLDTGVVVIEADLDDFVNDNKAFTATGGTNHSEKNLCSRI